MYNNQVNTALIKIVGLLGDFSKKEMSLYQKKLVASGFIADDYPVKNEDDKVKRDEGIEKSLKDLFYPDFRDIMFMKSNNDNNNRKLLSRRYKNEEKRALSLIKKNKDKSTVEFPIIISNTEIFLFPGQIGLFSITIEIDKKENTLDDINNIIFLSRQFETDTNKGQKWHEWISKNLISGIELRSNEKKIVKADEYSGSKFKVFSVIDCEEKENREALLYDMSTASVLTSGKGVGDYAPSKNYIKEILENKISIFNNWDALCLFDSFTCIGSNVITQEWQKSTWAYTYFRIYLYRLFFKYNIYRYNSELHDEPVKLRNQFEQFLNDFNLSHISFNFLPNEIYEKTGKALKLDEELGSFQARINKLSSAILEEKQSKTNMLLQVVTALGAISSVQPVFDGLSLVQKYLGWSNGVFYTLLVLILLGIALGLLAFLMPELVKKIIKKIKGKNENVNRI